MYPVFSSTTVKTQILFWLSYGCDFALRQPKVH